MRLDRPSVRQELHGESYRSVRAAGAGENTSDQLESEVPGRSTGISTVRRLSPRRNGAESPHVSRESTPTQALQELHLATPAPPSRESIRKGPPRSADPSGWSIGGSQVDATNGAARSILRSFAPRPPTATRQVTPGCQLSTEDPWIPSKLLGPRDTLARARSIASLRASSSPLPRS